MPFNIDKLPVYKFYFSQLLLFALLFFSITLKSQILIVGLTPGEEVNFSGQSASYDTVWVTGTGKLNITNSDFTVNKLIVVDSDARLNVAGGHFSLSGVGIFYGNSETFIKGDLHFAANLNAGGNSDFTIDSSTVDFPMYFMGQYQLIAFDSARFTISNSEFQLGSGKFGGGTIGKGTFRQIYTNYHSTVGISMTIGVNQGSSFISENCSGGFEIIIADSCNIDLQSTSRLVLWFSFAQGDSAAFSFPAADPQLLFTNQIAIYYFSDTIPGISGIKYNVALQDCDTVYWCVFQSKGSDLAISNSTLLACGERFGSTEKDTLLNFINDSTYASYNPSLSNRNLALISSKMFAWNFYPMDTSEIVIENSIFGEVLAFGNGTAYVENSICDGSGGYVGAYDNGKLYVRNSEIKRTYAGPAILLCEGNGFTEFINSKIIGGIILNGNSALIAGNTNYNQEPILNNAAYFVNALLNESGTVNISTGAHIWGSLYLAGGTDCFTEINHYKVEYSLPDSSGITVITDTICSPEIINDILCYWNTQGLSAGNYLLWLTAFLNNDTSFCINRPVIIDVLGNAFFGVQSPDLSVFPNPFSDKISVGFNNISNESIEVNLFDVSGKEVFSTYQRGLKGNTIQIPAKNMEKGVYQIIVKQNNTIVGKRKLIKI